MLGLGTSITKGGAGAKTIVTDNLLLKHNYSRGQVHKVSTGAAFFDGTDDYITMGDVCDLGTADFSIAFWVYLPEVTSQNLISKHVDDDDVWFIRTQGTDKIQFHAQVGGGDVEMTVIQTAIALTANTWHHVAFTCDRSDGSAGGKIYVDGAFTREAAGDATNINNSGNLELGRKGSTVMGGNMCCVGIWNTALSQAQVKSIMNKNYSGLTSSEKTNLVSWWNLDTLTEFDVDGTGDGLVLDNNATLGSELITGFTNGSTYPLDTFTSSGVNISAAVETSGDFGGCASNEFNLTVGECYKCTFDLTYNSGTDPVKVVLVHDANGASTHRSNQNFTSTNGENIMHFIVSGTDSTSRLQFGTKDEADVINFSASNISLKKINGNPGEIK